MDKGKGRQARLQAYDAIRRMERPDSITPTNWNRVEQLLWIIARRYPKAYPSQERLAAEMKLSTRTVRRLIRMAREAGLLTVWRDAGTKKRHSYSKTNWYHITELLEHEDKVSPLNEDRMAFEGTGDTSVSPYQQTPPSVKRTSFSSPTSGSARQRRGRTTVEKVDKSRAEQIAAAAGDRRIERRPRQKEFNPSRRLASHFLDQWENLCQHQTSLRDFRPADSVGQMVGYFRATFLAPVAGRVYTPDEVREYIDQFIEEVRRGDVQVKRKQSAFMRFCGWWGRDRSPDMPADVSRRYHEEALTKRQRAQ